MFGCCRLATQNATWSELLLLLMCIVSGYHWSKCTIFDKNRLNHSLNDTLNGLLMMLRKLECNLTIAYGLEKLYEIRKVDIWKRRWVFPLSVTREIIQLKYRFFFSFCICIHHIFTWLISDKLRQIEMLGKHHFHTSVARANTKIVPIYHHLRQHGIFSMHQPTLA